MPTNDPHVISGSEYVTLANKYGQLRSQLTSATTYLYDAVYTIVKFNEFEPTLDLLQVFYDTYTLQTNVLNSNTPYLGSVRALNNHVLLRATDPATNAAYTDINDWFTDQGVSAHSISSQWQDMCAEVGFDIDDGFVS